ncbi:MAG: hypothetical protein OXF44_07045 [Anaerolineaceae bacterium]|nr:hypothetical protein [Anaerolineaceae bacterium]
MMPPEQLERMRLRAAYRLFQWFSLEDQRNYWQRAAGQYRRAGNQVNFIVAVFAFIAGLAAALAGLLATGWLVPGSFANNGACAELADSQGLVRSMHQLGLIEQVEAEDDALEQFGELLATSPIAQARVDGMEFIAALNDMAGIDSDECSTVHSLTNLLMLVAVVAPAVGGAFTTLAGLYQWDRSANIYESALESLEVADSQSPLDDMDTLTYRAALRAYVENTLQVMSDESAQWGQSVRPPAQLEQFLSEEREKALRATRLGNAWDLGGGEDEGIGPLG